MPDLDRELSQARQDLLGDIHIPELSTVTRRAAGIRARRRGMVAAFTVAALALGAGVAVWPGLTRPEPAPVASPTPTPSPTVDGGWHSDGMSIWPLSHEVLEIDGSVYDVTFPTAQVGYALVSDCAAPTCGITFATTRDAGDTWTIARRFDAPDNDRPRLLAIGSAGVLIESRAATFFWDAARGEWLDRSGERPGVDPAPSPTDQLAGPPSNGDTCTPSPIRAWTIDGWSAPVASQPAMDVCRVAVARTGNGAWWVSGRAAGRPAVGVTTNGGRSWSVITLPAGSPGAWAQVSIRGPEVYASVVSTEAPPSGAVRVEAVYRSVDGRAFTAFPGGTGRIVGDLMPLADGRFVAANGRFLLTKERGGMLEATGLTPNAGRIVRTPAAWVALDLFSNGYVATSTDGLNWQKINIR